MLITIDGPTASGKTSLSDKLSKIINFNILHSGLIYRAIAKKILANKIDPENNIEVTKVATQIKFHDTNDESLSQEKIGNTASKIAKYQEIRNYANQIQHEFVNNYPNVIIEGRDAGTVVFPYADLKIFITATVKVRAQRRFKELQKKGIEVIYSEILDDLKKRDLQDTERSHAPLKMADDAVIIDTSNLSKKASLEKIVLLVKERLNLHDISPS